MGIIDDPLWYKDAIIYEVHVKSFRDSNENGYGDFRGLAEKLDYLQDLGVTALWLLPFYPSPLKDDGYDISDYLAVHPDYGTLQDFKYFLGEAHRRGLRVITELVINHTSDQHPWFQAARHAKPNSPQHDFYVWSDNDKKFSETRIIFCDIEKSNWAWDSVAGMYYWHRFFSHQPDLNHNNPRVVEEVIRVMNFWLDLGVDGMRLDAVPYLCVREGTNNENLPETHEVIKRIRAAVDDKYKSRMLLGEANMWPEEVRPYFGEGDECHMAFHFPVMPRLFIALRREDRSPIVDIMQRTPEIPESCQWGLFLRNHDELTLEMVTNDERDYMWREYASEPRMRLNLGIRRRLAPLMENSMPRIMLLNSILMSFPGSPIIYYGDEIGMGDNIYLGDRHGVRTPMQWSSERNAGFSGADPARLYLPVIMDPVYGYQAVNVESQQKDPSSLYHFMKRLIGLRRQFKAFSRGTMQFLHPRNKKVLAYTRSFKDEHILCLCNLSRFVQPVEVDLSPFAGATPVELIGRTEFPRITNAPYFFSMSPHSFYWFKLEPDPDPISLSTTPMGADGPSVPVVNVEDIGDSLLEQPTVQILDSEVFPSYLSRQRWFQGKARRIVSAKVRDVTKLGAGFYILLLEVSYAEGPSDTYVCPVRLVTGDAVERVSHQVPNSVIAQIRSGSSVAILIDALSDQSSCRLLLSAILDGRRFRSREGAEVRAYGLPTAGARLSGSPREMKVFRSEKEQSNSSVLFGSQAILKIFRRIDAGVNPDVEAGVFFSTEQRADFVPPLYGVIEYQQGEHVFSVAMLQQLVPSDGDAWGVLRAQLGETLTQPVSPPVNIDAEGFVELSRRDDLGSIASVLGGTEALVRALGKTTGEMHRLLSVASSSSGFAPIPVGEDYFESLADRFSTKVRAITESLNARMEELPGRTRDIAQRVIIESAALVESFRRLRDLLQRSGTLGSLLGIRCHGDYHLGQVLVSQGRCIVLDFEGEPLLPIEERKKPQPALKDVAGMLRSFGYAAQSLLKERGEESEQARVAASRWEKVASAVFLREYLDALGPDTPLLPHKPEELAALLKAFVLDKAYYELQYELGSRPLWVDIPLSGIEALLLRGTGR